LRHSKRRGEKMNRKDLLKWWHTISDSQVLDTFAGLPGSMRSKNWVYIEGDRAPADRLLLVAHCDTVQASPPLGLKWEGNILTGNNGTGSDDRAGCAMVWELQRRGHSILILDLEEIGGIGATDAVRELGPATLGAHALAVEFDRMGDCEHVTYSGTSSDDFRAWLKDAFPDWRTGWGSYTDIADICPESGLCGVNVGVGYLYQHSHREVLILDAWERCLERVSVVLGWPSYPAMVPDVRPVFEASEVFSRDWVAGGYFGFDRVKKYVNVVEPGGEIAYEVHEDDVPAFLLQSDGTVLVDDLEEWWGEEDSEEDSDSADPWDDRGTWARESGGSMPLI